MNFSSTITIKLKKNNYNSTVTYSFFLPDINGRLGCWLKYGKFPGIRHEQAASTSQSAAGILPVPPSRRRPHFKHRVFSNSPRLFEFYKKISLQKLTYKKLLV